MAGLRVLQESVVPEIQPTMRTRGRYVTQESHVNGFDHFFLGLAWEGEW